MDKELSGKKWSSGHQVWRKWIFIFVHFYIIFHLVAWYFLDWKFWGKTAMIGVLSLPIGKINAAAIMVAAILLSVLFYAEHAGLKYYPSTLFLLWPVH